MTTMDYFQRALGALLGAVMIAFSGGANAFTAIALIENNVTKSIYRTSNYDVQKEADNAALQGCRATAKTNGIGKLAKQCKIEARAREPGFGAVVCGTDGCSWGTGFDDAQEVVDAVYARCAKDYTNCQAIAITAFEDYAGFAKKTASERAPVAADCRPRTNTLQCSSSCNNGSCVVKYENGCQMRVQVQPRFNGFNNQWEYPAPSC